MAITLKNFISFASYRRHNDSKATCAHQVRWGQTDTLTVVPMGRCNRGAPLARQIIQLRPDIVITSAGPHVYGDGNFQAVLKHVRDELAPKGGAACG